MERGKDHITTSFLRIHKKSAGGPDLKDKVVLDKPWLTESTDIPAPTRSRSGIQVTVTEPTSEGGGSYGALPPIDELKLTESPKMGPKDYQSLPIYDSPTTQRRITPELQRQFNASLENGEYWLLNYSELKIVSILARGPGGNTFLAIWRDDEYVVFKNIEAFEKEEEVRLFKQEASMLMHLKPHQNVVKLYGICLDPLKPVGIVLEYVELGSLRSLLDTLKPLPMTQIISTAQGIAKGIKHLHHDNRVHRNLTAKAVLVDKGRAGSWICKVSSFGRSRTLIGSKGYSDNIGGPEKWMAPESLQDQIYSKKSDVWMFGCTLIEIITLKDPYPGVDSAHACERIMNYTLKPDIPKSIPVLLQNLLEKCFLKDPHARPDMKDILDQLTHIGKELQEMQ